MLFGCEEVHVFKLSYPCYFYTSKRKLEPLCYWYAVSIFLLLRTFIFFLPKRKQILDLHALKIISTLRCQACSVKCLIFLTTIRHRLFLWKHLPALMDMLAYILPYMHTTCLLSSVLADIALLRYNGFIYMQQYITLFKSLIVYLYLFPPFFCRSLISYGYEK